ncbi:UbiA family prenyltransferase [Nocardiopsis alborubida]|uniref:UbiA family prenyltransferase n=1 Tax=Nocardiopsis alborubida TaxID=146802 RepID=A0A7X6RPH4_9ACTN|nr:UbiA family prenyltransferase [Nocardiopsis alborubida]NKY97196.1 UbiA family prenyltransferase [Nocardiopsis alborubida]
MNGPSTGETARAGRSVLGTAVSFARLGKMGLFEIWLGPVVAWSLVAGTHGNSVRTAVLCLLFSMVIAFGIWATHALDDITGYRDGSDVRNYAPERRRSQVKPLVLGQLSVRQAQVFAFSATAAALACVVLFSVVSAFQPWWAFVGGLAVVVLGVQYSAGINFSYRFTGGGETVTGLTLAASLLVPYAAARGALDPAAVVQGLLFGAWLVQVLICSNSADAEDDRKVGRRTVASRTTERGNRVFVSVFFAATWSLALGAVLLGVLSPWTPLALLPAWALQALVLRNGLRGRWRNRRNHGFLSLRLAVLGLVIVNVLG